MRGTYQGTKNIRMLDDYSATLETPESTVASGLQGVKDKWHVCQKAFWGLNGK
jgi:hypothetical protein